MADDLAVSPPMVPELTRDERRRTSWRMLGAMAVVGLPVDCARIALALTGQHWLDWLSVSGAALLAGCVGLRPTTGWTTRARTTLGLLIGAVACLWLADIALYHPVGVGLPEVRDSRGAHHLVPSLALLAFAAVCVLAAAVVGWRDRNRWMFVTPLPRTPQGRRRLILGGLLVLVAAIATWRVWERHHGHHPGTVSMLVMAGTAVLVLPAVAGYLRSRESRGTSEHR